MLLVKNKLRSVSFLLLQMKRTHDAASPDTDSQGSAKRRKANPKHYLVAEFAKDPIKIALPSSNGSIILGRTNEVLAPHLDAFVSRNAASVEVNADGDALIKVVSNGWLAGFKYLL